jgi:hypothetical protein
MHRLLNFRMKYGVVDYGYTELRAEKEHFKSYTLFRFVLEKLAYRTFVF